MRRRGQPALAGPGADRENKDGGGNASAQHEVFFSRLFFRLLRRLHCARTDTSRFGKGPYCARLIGQAFLPGSEGDGHIRDGSAE